jgi:hypothetical protein
MDTAAPTDIGPHELSQRTAERFMRRRRRRVLRGVLAFTLSFVLVLVLTAAQRDAQSRRQVETMLTQLVGLLNERYVHAPLPYELPLGDVPTLRGAAPAAVDRWRNRVVYMPAQRARLRERDCVLVCYTDPEMKFYLGANGRFLVVFDGTRYSLEWLTSAAFPARAAELGLEPATGT